MKRNKALMRFFLIFVMGLCIGVLCACKEEGIQEEGTAEEEEQPGEVDALESINTENDTLEMQNEPSEEEKAIYEAYLQAAYAGGDWLYAYCDFDSDEAMELYIRSKDSERNYGRVMKYSLGGVTFLESGEIGEEYIEELSWMEMPWEALHEQEEMVHEGIYVYAAQSVETHDFWYPDEQAFLGQYGFSDEEPFYEYIMPDGTRRLKFLYDEETQFGCGIDYYERDPSDIMTSGACGFSFQGLSGECYKEGLAVDYSGFDTIYGYEFSKREECEETIEYTSSGQVSHYELNGVIEDDEEPDILLWMDYQYYPNGNLKERYYYHNPRMFGTWSTTWQSYFDTRGRLEHEYIYITHGWLEYYYLYEDEGKEPVYCLQLDNNLGWFMPEFMKYE